MAQKSTAETLFETIETRLHEVGEVFIGDTLDDYTWALLCELVLPEKFRAPPVDPRPLPAHAAADPEARVRGYADRHARGVSLFAPHDPPKPAGEDGSRGLIPAGPGLTPKQMAVRPMGHRRTATRSVG